MYARDEAASVEHWHDATDDQIHTTAEFFRMLADPTRLRLLIALLDNDRDVTALAAAVQMARPTVSQHLAKLRIAGLVTTRRHGRHALYRLRGGHVRALLTHALAQADHGLRQLPDHD
jgi:DNA-binding transcriptional ArsR family regulator